MVEWICSVLESLNQFPAQSDLQSDCIEYKPL